MADHAIIIGIETYPGMNDLQGPCNDAELFEAWLKDPEGGNLTEANITRRLSCDFDPPTDIDDAHPVLSDLETLFRPFVRKAVRNEHTEGRLFIYVAGHGFADTQDMDSAALFTADAEFLYPLHLAVLDYANFFRRTWAFDEIIVIMDACRSTNALQEISKAPLPRVNPHPNANKVKMFLGFGAGHNRPAREREIGGKVHGIFTMTLLDALKKAPTNSIGKVNGSAIKRHIHNSIATFAGSTDIYPPDIIADENKDVFFVAREPSGTDVAFTIDPAHHDRELIISFGGVDKVQQARITETPIVMKLLPGLYKAEIEGTTANTIFEVPKDVTINL